MGSPSSPRPLTLEDLWSFARVGSPSASRDGSVVVVTATRYTMEQNRGTSRLYRVDLGGGPSIPLTAEEVSASQPSVSPSGACVAFVRKEPDGKPQLALLPLDGGEAEVLTKAPLGVLDPKWFPDEKRIAFLAWVYADAPTFEATGKRHEEREKDPVKAHVTEDRVYRYWDTWLTDGRVLHLFVIDLATREVTDLLPQSRMWFDLMEPAGCYDISPDGTEIALSADRSEPPHGDLDWDVFLLNVATRSLTNITSGNPGHDTRPRYSPDGRWILYGLEREKRFYADRVRLTLYDRKPGTHKVLTEDWDRSAMNWAFAPDGAVVFLAEDEERVSLFRLSIPDGKPERLQRGGTLGDPLPLADGAVLFMEQTISRPAELVRHGSRGTSRLTAFNDAMLSEISWGEVRELTFTGSEGRSIQSYLVLPPGFDPKRKWPMILVLHGGPHGITGDQFHYRWNLQLMAAPGYVVLAPNFHGSTSRGQDFAASILGGWGDKPYRDSMAAVDALLAEGYVDSKRVAVAGGSYGGYLVTWIAGQTDRFACIVNHAGVSDLMSSYASDVTYGRELSMGGEPWSNLGAIDRMNPVRFAKGFKTPMLVVHGEKDYRVPVTQGISIYNMMKAKGVPARLVIYPDENHWVLKPRNARLWYAEFFSWLERWIGPGGPDKTARNS